MVVALVIAILFISASIVTEHYIFPKLSHVSFLTKYPIFQMASENVTIINNTQEVRISEDDVLQKLSRDNKNSLASIISRVEGEEGLVSRGAFVTADGVIMTYKDALISDATGEVIYTVVDSEGTVYEAELLDIDSFTHLAFLKVEGTNFSAVRFANSDDFGPGKKVLYVGVSSTSGEEQIASGIITERAYDFNIAPQSVASTEKLEGVFLAQINTTHDLIGSPVMSMQGEVVGITGKKVYDGNEVMFIIPSNQVQDTLEYLTQNNSFDRPEFGAYYLSLNKTIALQYGLSRDVGAWVYVPSGRQSLAVLSSSPAALAGIKVGDIIMSINDEAITLHNPLSNSIQRLSPGDKATLTILRNEKELNIEVQL